MKPRWLTLVFLAASLAFAGCAIPGCDEYDPAMAAEYAAKMDELNQQLESIQGAVIPALVKLEADGIIDQDTAERIAKATEEIDRVQPQVQQITQALQTDPGPDLVGTIQRINDASTPFNPYSPYISLGLTGLTAILGLFAQKKSSEAKKANTAVSELVAAGEQIKAGTEFKAAQNAAQSIETQKKVASVRKELAA